MLIIDSREALKDRRHSSARGAGIAGFSIFGKKHTYALNADLSLNETVLEEFWDKYRDEHVLIFGFTNIVYQSLFKNRSTLSPTTHFAKASLVHGGGWKKLIAEQVSTERYRELARETLGNVEVSNYYGMAEQTGTIYLECSEGHLHASKYSDLIIRDKNSNEAEIAEEGLIQVLSPIAYSYPDIVSLTEDLGTILGIDDCPCGRKGKYFSYFGTCREGGSSRLQ